MNKKRRLAILGGMISFCGCLAIISGLWITFLRPPTLPPEVATVKHPSISPSGKYELSVIETNSQVLNFQIRSLDNDSSFISDDTFSASHTTFFLWDDNNHVWVYSGDIGTYFWTLASDGTTWIKSDYDANTPAPRFLREIRPNYHPW